MKYALPIILQVIIWLVCERRLVSGQDPDCDYYQEVIQGQTYYVYSKKYPNNYGPSETCRWEAQCPVGTLCHISCILEIPSTEKCDGDRLVVSRTGDLLLTGGDKYCGTGTVELSSLSNSLTMALITSPDTIGGRFLCYLTAVPDENAVVNPPCECGWQKQTRIVGGEETKVNEFPLMAALIDLRITQVSCGATIISNRWVVTAAHCLDALLVGDTSVLVGEHDLTIQYETEATDLIRAETFIQHPQYVIDEYEYDIALVRTIRDITFSDEVGPACLPFQLASETFDGVTVQALGWGSTSFSGPTSDFLQKVSLTVIDVETCRNSLGSTIVNERKLCTFESGKDTCQFDSGGPLVWLNTANSRYYLVGIISVGFGCATSRPSVNTRVTEYLNWIREATSNEQYCSA